MNIGEEPVLQVALDEMVLSRAVEMAREAVEGGVDWIEVGTPLIKSEGMEAVRTMKRLFPDRVVVADMKTMDTGGYEVEMAAKAGADVVCVLGVADDETIREAVESARNYGASVMVDLLGCRDPVGRAGEVEALGADIVGVHVGIDQQMRGEDPLAVLREVTSAVSVPVAVAGGINPSTAGEVVEAGASIVIVGSAITKAPDIPGMVCALKTSMAGGKAEAPKDFRRRKREEIARAFREVSTCNISDALHRRGVLEGIKPVYMPIGKMVGRALTVETVDGDWAKPVEAIERAGPGVVIVISARPGDRAVWGELATNSCLVKGVEGVVVDGAMRDVPHLRELGLPVFSSKVRPNAGDPRGLGRIGGGVICGEQYIRDGDWMIGDDTGVVVVPAEKAVETANRALEVRDREGRIREEIKRGRTLSEVLELLKWEQVG
ncbi:MAG: orotidine 5'-phosphate decarboxylase [Thermoplasmata archaeon]|nr:orotidine 5'-phosphate decarboxylase [Thermoplasmata archaeon]